jgi:hypothetical protein
MKSRIQRRRTAHKRAGKANNRGDDKNELRKAKTRIEKLLNYYHYYIDDDVDVIIGPGMRLLTTSVVHELKKTPNKFVMYHRCWQYERPLFKLAKRADLVKQTKKFGNWHLHNNNFVLVVDDPVKYERYLADLMKRLKALQQKGKLQTLSDYISTTWTGIMADADSYPSYAMVHWKGKTNREAKYKKRMIDFWSVDANQKQRKWIASWHKKPLRKRS